MKIPVFHDDQHGTAIIVGRRPAQRDGPVGRDRGRQDRGQWRRCCRLACLELLKAMGARHENVWVRPRACLSGRTELMDQWKSPSRRRRPTAHARRRAWRCRRLPRRLGARRAEAGDGRGDGEAADHLRPGQPDPEILPGGGLAVRPTRSICDRPLGLSEPGQQRAGLPLHLPRGARRARDGDQRGDEDRGGEGDRGARQGAALGRGPAAYGGEQEFGPTTSSRRRSIRG
jgi:hypothetical protein